MASGTLFSLALSQQVDDNGTPLGGCLLYTYLAGTTTPYTTFRTAALTTGTENTWPLVADSSGRIPQFWLDSANTYKARLTTAAGVLIFEIDSIPAIGPGTGGGGVDTTDPNSIAATGDFKWRPVDSTLDGWVRANGRTIGNGTSGAIERANADTQSLFEYLWNTFSNTICAVSGGRGANAAADFSASKAITLLDLRGRTPFGLDSMGNSAAARLTGTTFSTGDKDTAASVCGSNLHTLTTGESGQKAISAAPVTITDPGHAHTTAAAVETVTNAAGTNPAWLRQGSPYTGFAPTNTTGISASLTLAGSSAVSGHNNMPPAMVGTWYIRL